MSGAHEPAIPTDKPQHYPASVGDLCWPGLASSNPDLTHIEILYSPGTDLNKTLASLVLESGTENDQLHRARRQLALWRQGKYPFHSLREPTSTVLNPSARSSSLFDKFWTSKGHRQTRINTPISARLGMVDLRGAINQWSCRIQRCRESQIREWF